MMMFNNNRRSSQTSQNSKGSKGPRQAPGNASRPTNSAGTTRNTTQGQRSGPSRNINQQRQTPGARSGNQSNQRTSRRNQGANNTVPNISDVLKSIANANANINTNTNTNNANSNIKPNTKTNTNTPRYVNTPSTNYAHQGQYPPKTTPTGGNRTVNKQSLFDNPVFRNISPAKMNYLRDMVTDMENKPQELKPQVLMTYVMRMRQEGINFTSEELGAVTTALRPTMSDAENRQFDNMVNLMRNMQR